MPDEVIERPKVSFFHRNLEQWFRGRLGASARDYLLNSSPRYARVLDQRAVSDLARDYFAGRAKGREHFLLAVLMLEIWLSEFLPRAMGTAEPSARDRLSA